MKPIFEIVPEPIPKKDTEIFPFYTNPSAPEILNPDENHPSPTWDLPSSTANTHSKRRSAPSYSAGASSSCCSNSSTSQPDRWLRQIRNERKTALPHQFCIRKIGLYIPRMTLCTAYLLYKTHWMIFYFYGVEPRIAKEVSFLASSEFTTQHLQRELRLQI